MKVGDVVLDLHDEECVVTAVDEKNQTATVYNLKPGMYNPRILEINSLRLINESR